MSRYFSMFLTVLISASVAHAEDPKAFKDVEQQRLFSFPRDHGAHPEYETEWWYFTGHLHATAGETFGFELTFFRIGFSPLRTLENNWDTNSIYFAHFALTDDSGKRIGEIFPGEKFQHRERRSRGAFGEAGAAEDTLNVWIDSWSAKLRGDKIELQAADTDFEIELSLDSRKSPALHGENGLSRKGGEKGAASYYYSLTRLTCGAPFCGRLRVGDNTLSIEKAAVWMDQETTSNRVAGKGIGWDWFAVQLSDNSEIMLYHLKNPDGSISSYSSGTIISPEGSVEHLSESDFSIRTLANWTSLKTKTIYPSKWEIRIPSRSISLVVTPTVSNQELTTTGSTGVNYWEGRSLVTGQLGQKTADGEAYVELVGYKPTP